MTSRLILVRDSDFFVCPLYNENIMNIKAFSSHYRAYGNVAILVPSETIPIPRVFVRHLSFLFRENAPQWPANIASLEKGTSRTGLSTGSIWFWFWSWEAWKLLKIESISFSGYFSFRNIVLRSWHSFEKRSGEDDKRLAPSSIVLISDCLYLLLTWL